MESEDGPTDRRSILEPQPCRENGVQSRPSRPGRLGGGGGGGRAGADVFRVPPRSEPCGLTQICSLKYGTVPVVRTTGGLADTVVDADEDPSGGGGFKLNRSKEGGVTSS